MMNTEDKLTMSLDDLIASGKNARSKAERGPSRKDRTRVAADNDDNDRLSMSLDDLINKDKTSQSRQRSPRGRRFQNGNHSHTNDSRSQKSRTVKITNVPYDLTWKELKEAFSSIGSIERCDVDYGTARIRFSDSRGATAAVKSYDGGEMNGRRIKVVLE